MDPRRGPLEWTDTELKKFCLVGETWSSMKFQRQHNVTKGGTVRGSASEARQASACASCFWRSKNKKPGDLGAL